MRMLAAVRFIARKFFEPGPVTWQGCTALPRHARDVFTRWRRGESILDGSHIAEFERALRDSYGGSDAVTFGAGRMALYAILRAMDLAKGDEIILPGYTCVVTSNAIRHAGGTPVYVDVSRDDFNLLPEQVSSAVTRRTRAILAQHTFGIPCDMPALLDIGRKHGVPVIEDGAHAIGARLDGRQAGQFGLAAFFSTQQTKMINTDRGGYVVTAEAGLARRVRDLQRQAPFRDEAAEREALRRWCYGVGLLGRPGLNNPCQVIESLLGKLGVRWRERLYAHEEQDYQAALAGRQVAPYPARLGNLLAYAGLCQLRRLDEDLAHRRRLAALLEERLPALGAKLAVYDHRRAQPSWVRFPLIVEDRPAWADWMRRHRLEPGYWLNHPIHPVGCDWKKALYVPGSCPNAEFLAEHVLNVPVDHRVTPQLLRSWLESAPPGARH